MGFDKAFNYKTSDLATCLKEAAPNGVDCYFDNVRNDVSHLNTLVRFSYLCLFKVGGLLSSTVRNHMKDFGRISVCGCISTYNDKTPTLAPSCEGAFVFKQLKMEGFLVHRWTSRWMEGLSQMAKWIQEVEWLIR